MVSSAPQPKVERRHRTLLVALCRSLGTIARTHADIEVRAYYRYLKRGLRDGWLQDGFDLDDWLAAEDELRAKAGARITTAAR